MDKREQARQIVDKLPLATFQRDRALAGIERMDDADIEDVLRQFARMEELLPIVLGERARGGGAPGKDDAV